MVFCAIFGLFQPGLYAEITASLPSSSFAMASSLPTSSFTGLTRAFFGSFSTLRTTAVTSCPRSTNSFNIAEPTKPVAPINTTFAIILLFFSLLFVVCLQVQS